ncbi:glycoside hydrolase [Micromonospora sp. DR5-3]|uniref:sialidase family protein n=1 Tax=unclassified Micromonospora TaxID=2617518 RepID=UPI0011DA6B9F|nr:MULTISPECIES: sialidase family protein [unclassified Micromonospora]MCW3819243.1 glycoside hydrolase [Micromonospora sp. DR5-3]TYC20978.1 exo-alpha-sialidase [Micromonospora sp. MP36]
MPELDFAGLNAAAQAGFKPHFEQVALRARRRRQRHRIVTVAALAMLVAGSGVAVAARPAHERPAVPAPGFSPEHTPEFIPTPGPTLTPGPGRQVSTGRPGAGDLDHIYLRYHECRTGCPPRWAGTDDRGRHWRTGPLPVPDDAMVDLRVVAPRTLVAWYLSRSAPDSRSARWAASSDGGATWRQVEARQVDALPAGWRVLAREPGPDREPLVAVDPATGDVAQLTKRSTLQNTATVASAPIGAGLWVSGRTGKKVGDGGRVIWTGSAVEVSRDGGRTWRRHEFPDGLTASDDIGGPAVATQDGRTVYAVGRVRGALVVWRSADGGATWARTAGTAKVGERTIRAALRPDGVLLVQAGVSAAEEPLMFASSDDGAALHPAPLGPGADPRPVTGGYVQTGWPDSTGAWLSADGVTWTWIDPPEL